jgi:glyoxylase-like metal-dependent hydrolase (beta-lactamase superfamily II)
MISFVNDPNELKGRRALVTNFKVTSPSKNDVLRDRSDAPIKRICSLGCDLCHSRPRRSFLWTGSLLERFPRARGVAPPEVAKAMLDHLSSDRIENFWRRLFPGEIPDRLLVAEPLQNNELELEGHKLISVKAGRTDTAHSTCLYVPSIGLIVAGDAVYNGIHPFLGETDKQSRLEWISTLDKLEALQPKAVVAGHKVPENDDHPHIIAETRQYLRDFSRLNEATVTARQLYDAMLELYPDRVNPGSLWGAANTAKKQA